MTNYVKFLRGTPSAFAALETKDKDTLYFISAVDATVGKLYLGDILVAGNVTPEGDSIVDSLGELIDVNLAGLKTGQVLSYNGTEWVPMTLPEAIEVSEMTGATADLAGAAGLVPAPQVGDQNKFLRGDGTWVEVITNLSDYVKQSDFNELSTRVNALEEIGAEKNIIQTVDVNTLNVTEDRKLELKAVPQNIVTGLTKTSWMVQEVEDGDDIFIAQTTVANLEDILKPATFNSTTKIGTSGLMTAEQVQKLQALVITDEGIQVSGKVNADNVEGLGSWITTNRNTIEGLYSTVEAEKLSSLDSKISNIESKLNSGEIITTEKFGVVEDAVTWGAL